MLEIRRKRSYTAAAVGSALMDITVQADDSLLMEMGLKPGSMTLIDEQQSREILNFLEAGKGLSPVYTPGGSSANCIDGINALGGRCVFMGSVGSCQIGKMFLEATEQSGVKPLIAKFPGLTGHAITFITGDGERTFATHLGASQLFSAGNVDEEAISSASVIHFEGFFLEKDNLYEASVYAMNLAKKYGTAVSLDLSDAALIERIRPRMDEAVNRYADIIFANEEEARAYTGFEPEQAAEALGKICSFAAVKWGERGSFINSGGRVYRIAPVHADVVNTNGAGDMYAASVIYGLVKGLSAEDCGHLASAAASMIVERSGARAGEFPDPGSLLEKGRISSRS